MSTATTTSLATTMAHSEGPATAALEACSSKVPLSPSDDRPAPPMSRHRKRPRQYYGSVGAPDTECSSNIQGISRPFRATRFDFHDILSATDTIDDSFDFPRIDRRIFDGNIRPLSLRLADDDVRALLWGDYLKGTESCRKICHPGRGMLRSATFTENLACLASIGEDHSDEDNAKDTLGKSPKLKFATISTKSTLEGVEIPVLIQKRNNNERRSI